MTLDGLINSGDFLRRRERIAEYIQAEIYGNVPPRPIHVNVEIISENKITFGKQVTKGEYRLVAETARGNFSFPFTAYIPLSEKPIPAFVHIDAQGSDSLVPIEEIADRNFALFSFDASKLTGNKKSPRASLARALFENRRARSAPGKIAVWAWASMRVMDFISTLDTIDQTRVAVIGHSALADAALLAGGLDGRFSYVISSCSAISALIFGEALDSFNSFGDASLLFCPGFSKRLRSTKTPDIDLALVFSLSTPRSLIIANTTDSPERCYKGEVSALCSLDRVYSLYGKSGAGSCPSITKAPIDFGRDSFYHLRDGAPFLGRYDFNAYMDIISSSY